MADGGRHPCGRHFCRENLWDRKLLEALPSPSGSWPDAPPESGALAQLHQLTRAIFYQLEETQ